MMDIIDYKWKTLNFMVYGKLADKPLGIVLGQDRRTGKYGAYVGLGNSGEEEMDALFILQGGAKLGYKEALGFFPQVLRKQQANYKYR